MKKLSVEEAEDLVDLFECLEAIEEIENGGELKSWEDCKMELEDELELEQSLAGRSKVKRSRA